MSDDDAVNVALEKSDFPYCARILILFPDAPCKNATLPLFDAADAIGLLYIVSA